MRLFCNGKSRRALLWETPIWSRGSEATSPSGSRGTCTIRPLSALAPCGYSSSSQPVWCLINAYYTSICFKWEDVFLHFLCYLFGKLCSKGNFIPHWRRNSSMMAIVAMLFSGVIIPLWMRPCCTQRHASRIWYSNPVDSSGSDIS